MRCTGSAGPGRAFSTGRRGGIRGPRCPSAASNDARSENDELRAQSRGQRAGDGGRASRHPRTGEDTDPPIRGSAPPHGIHHQDITGSVFEQQPDQGGTGTARVSAAAHDEETGALVRRRVEEGSMHGPTDSSGPDPGPRPQRPTRIARPAAGWSWADYGVARDTGSIDPVARGTGVVRPGPRLNRSDQTTARRDRVAQDRASLLLAQPRPRAPHLFRSRREDREQRHLGIERTGEMERVGDGQGCAVGPVGSDQDSVVGRLSRHPEDPWRVGHVNSMPGRPVGRTFRSARSGQSARSGRST